MKIELDVSKAEKLRDLVNDNNLMVCYDAKLWNKLCVIMDRIEDIANHLNKMDLKGTELHMRSAFNFYDILNHSSVMIECIHDLFSLMDINPPTPSKIIFSEPGNDGNGNDDEYYKYLRALCSVHPNKVALSKNYIQSDQEFCPSVLWRDKNTLEAIVYPSNKGDVRFIGIGVTKIIDYIVSRYDYLDLILPALNQKREKFVKSMKRKYVKRGEDFKDINEFIDYLIMEENKRFGQTAEYLNVAKILLNINIENKENGKVVEKYFNSIKLSLEYFALSLQYLGTVNPENENEKNSYDSYNKGDLLDKVVYPEKEGIFKDLTNDQKFYLRELMFLDPYVNYDYGIKLRAKIGYNNIGKDLINKYFGVDDISWDDPQVYLFYQASKYFECLKYDTFLNKNIPNYINYRLK